MFNGDLTTAAGIKSSTTEFFVDNIGIENVTSVEVLGYCTSGSNGGYNQYYVNELSFVPNVSRSCNETDVWTTLYSGTPITLNKITGKSANPSFSSEIYAVRVNGILMLDKGIRNLGDSRVEYQTNGGQGDIISVNTDDNTLLIKDLPTRAIGITAGSQRTKQALTSMSLVRPLLTNLCLPQTSSCAPPTSPPPPTMLTVCATSSGS